MEGGGTAVVRSCTPLAHSPDHNNVPSLFAVRVQHSAAQHGTAQRTSSGGTPTVNR